MALTLILFASASKIPVNSILMSFSVDGCIASAGVLVSVEDSYFSSFSSSVQLYLSVTDVFFLHTFQLFVFLRCRCGNSVLLAILLKKSPPISEVSIPA